MNRGLIIYAPPLPALPVTGRWRHVRVPHTNIADLGVTSVDTGLPLVRVLGRPEAGQYAVNEKLGRYRIGPGPRGVYPAYSIPTKGRK